MFSDHFFIDVKKISIAHEFTLDRVNGCAYPLGRTLYGLVYVLEGGATYRFSDGKRLSVVTGDTIFLTPNASYSIVTDGDFRHYTVNFDIHRETSAAELSEEPYCLLRGEGTEQFRRAFAELIHVWRARKSGYEMQAIGRLYEILSNFYFEYVNRWRSASYRSLRTAREYVEQHFDQPISLGQLARISSMSVTNFRREWKKLYDETPMQYRDSIRLHCAREYLSSGYYTVSEIARACGFEDVSYFIRFFRKKTGITPGDYKSQSQDV